MCGIAGFLTSEGALDHATVLRQMTALLAHRGPDGDGHYLTATAGGRARVGLGHRRLAIIDLATGAQPMSNGDGSIQVVFNGEIYNFQALRAELAALGHVFRTSSDTEAIVYAYAQWGEACFARLRGMFAIAVWDRQRDRLVLARDRFGEKPLFYRSTPNALVFASEVKAILAFPGGQTQANLGAIADYLSYRYVPAPDTLFEGVRKLMPGCYAIWENGVLREHRYYQAPDRAPRVPVPDTSGDVVGRFLELLDDAVRVRMVADVPFGAFLSGGLDSSGIVALMARQMMAPVKTFSVGFDIAAYSELRYAAQVARRFGTDHHELTVNGEHMMALLPAMVRQRDAPVAEPSDIAIYLLAQEARRSVKMVLTGEGADEFLGGYPKHVYERLAQPYQRLSAALRHRLINPLVQGLPYRFRRAKTAATTLGLEAREERMPRWFGALSHGDRARLLALPTPVRTQAIDALYADPANSALRQILYFDQASWLPDNLLERGDSMTMAASLEARMPFVDVELAAFASSLPDHYRVRGRTTKWILREAMQRVLPREILQRPKVGFRVPVNEWFRGPMKDYLYGHLTGPSSRTAHYYDAGQLDKVLGDHVAGRQNHEKLLWTLLSLEIWHRECLAAS
jgi:asparagine synthase (glutamine-hydrolysing)